MSDISLPWGQDIDIDDTGDIVAVDGVDELVQRVIRRFLTNSYLPPAPYQAALPPDYIFDNTYGGNVRRYVDRRLPTGVLQKIQTNLLNCMQQEAEVSTTTPPSVTAWFASGTVYVQATATLANGQILSVPAMAVI